RGQYGTADAAFGIGAAFVALAIGVSAAAYFHLDIQSSLDRIDALIDLGCVDELSVAHQHPLGALTLGVTLKLHLRPAVQVAFRLAVGLAIGIVFGAALAAAAGVAARFAGGLGRRAFTGRVAFSAAGRFTGSSALGTVRRALALSV